MTQTKVKRSQIATFVNTSSTSGASYSLLGIGVAAGQKNMNPEVTEEQYISEDAKTVTVDAYGPKMPIEMTAIAGEPIFDFVNDLCQNQAVLDAAMTDVVDVNLYQSSNTSGYPATKTDVSISIEDAPGGESGKPAKISFTFHYTGAGVSGRYNVSSGSFAAN